MEDGTGRSRRDGRRGVVLYSPRTQDLVREQLCTLVAILRQSAKLSEQVLT